MKITDIKKKLLQPIKALPYRLHQLPKGVLGQYASQGSCDSRHGINYEVFEPSSREEFSYSAFDSASKSTIKKTLSINFSDLVKITISNGVVWGTDGIILSPTGYVVPEASREFGALHANDLSIHNGIRVGRIKKVKGVMAVINSCGSNNYCHWLVEILARCRTIDDALQKNQTIDIIYASNSLPFQKELLSLLRLDRYKIICPELESKPYYQADKLLAASVFEYTFNRASVHYLREKLLGFSQADSKRQNTRLYIDRRKPLPRSIVNDEEIKAYLVSIGFKIIACETMSVREQIEAFSGADVIVAPHGAGLTNTIFCKPGTIVVDIVPPDWQGIAFTLISHYINLRYLMYVSLKDADSPLLIRGSGQNSAMSVNLPDFKRTLKELGV